MATDSSEQWKRKYHTALHQLEEKEDELSRLDELLRHSVARLSLVANGLHPKLDRYLEKLRKAARGRDNAATIQGLIDDLSEVLRELELKSAAPSGDAIVTLLAEGLAGLDFPAELGREARILRTRFATGTPPHDPRVALEELFALLRKAAPRREPPECPVPAPPAVEVPSRAPAVVAPSSREAAAILVSLLDRLAAQHPQPDKVHRLRDRLQARPPPDLRLSVAEIAHLYAAPGAVAAVPATMPEGVAGREQPVAAALLRLLDNMATPQELRETATALREEILEGTMGWDDGVTAVARFIGEAGQRLEQEKKELEGFLHQLTQRLGELDAHLQGAERERSGSVRSGRDLNDHVQVQMNGIESSVREATSLGDLKETIANRLEGIRRSLGDYRRQEEERQTRLGRELQQVTARLQAMEQETEELRTNLEQRHQQARLDALTGVANRTAYEERLAQEHAAWKRYRAPLSIAMIDVDNFKAINDTYGHKAGDKALVLIGRVLRQALRETDFLARYGGEEFVALFRHTPIEGVAQVVEKLRLAVAEAKFHNSGVPVPITVSVGFAAFQDQDTAEAVFERADQALYQAKRAGRNRCVAADGR